MFSITECAPVAGNKSALCPIEGCQGRVLAKGLCAKHYMRARRTGDPNKTGKRGRKPDPDFPFPWMSRRTRARFKEAAHLLWLVEGFGYKIDDAIQHATRPDGTLKVNRLLSLVQLSENKGLILP
jgi:hypothetical protein